MGEDEQLSDNEKQEIRDLLGYGSNLPDAKHSVHSFLNSIATADNTLKLGYLKEEELGTLKNTVRGFQHLANFSDKIMNKPELQAYFKDSSEIITASSLSRDGFLVDRAVVQKRELKDTTAKPKKQNSSWFKKKDNTQQAEGGVE